MGEPSPKKKRNKPSEKKDHILNEIRADIVRGRYAPGERLPTRTELQDRFSAGRATIQLAMDDLAAEGFTRPRGRSGTVVVDKPPHLFRYALVFPTRPSAGWPQFFTALAHEALHVEQASGRQIKIYYDDLSVVPHNDDFSHLYEDVNRRRLAGIIFASSPHALSGSDLISQPPIPTVAIMTNKTFPRIPVVSADGESFMEKALDYFASKGRSRVAMMSVVSNKAHEEEAARRAAKRGMVMHVHWQQCLPLSIPAAATNLARLLFHPSQSERPDCLIIRDDNIVQSAILGMLDTGVRIPSEVEVIAHCNLPWPTPSMVPLKRLGYDTYRFLTRCMEIIDAQNRGEPVPDVSPIQADFADAPGLNRD